MESSLQSEILSAINVTKYFTDGEFITKILDNINLKIRHGEMVAIVGPSGSGKSTLLHILCGLDEPNNGIININNIPLSNLSDYKKSFIRNNYLSFIYQFHHLLSEFSVLENVAMPLLLRDNIDISEVKYIAEDILLKLGLEKKINSFTYDLSGGEKQRVSIARALITKPKCILADEPTGNLDNKNAMLIYDLIKKLNEELNIAFVIVTHDFKIANKMQYILKLENGKIMG